MPSKENKKEKFPIKRVEENKNSQSKRERKQKKKRKERKFPIKDRKKTEEIYRKVFRPDNI